MLFKTLRAAPILVPRASNGIRASDIPLGYEKLLKRIAKVLGISVDCPRGYFGGDNQ